MYVDITSSDEGWHGLSIAIKKEEIDSLINLLEMIKNDNDQHFHITNHFDDESGVADIEFYIKDEKQKDNMALLGTAKLPGEEI